MSLGPSFDAKERVKQAIDIVELVGSYLQLRREGRGYKALCPWHDDTRPSLQVNPERQSFKCWVCDLGGDVFSFLMKIEGVQFPEALAMLADRAGIDIKPARGEAGSRAADEKRLLYQAAAWAEQQFHECLLRAPEAEAARRYLAGRGITEQTVRRFHLGYSPDSWSWLLEKARGTLYTPKTLHTLGLVGQRQGGNGYYDRFKGRVLFSIRDTQGRPVAVGGRVLPESAQPDAAKYINSPESPLYSKSNTLYALDAARDVISKTRHAMVMEGYTDVLVAQQCGFGDALAVCGTALGQRHIQLLRRYADTITLVLDGDEAGQRRTNEILELFVAEQVDLRILTLPEGLDPCDFLLTRGEPPFRQLLSGAVDALEHKIRVATREIDVTGGTHGANQALEEILGTLAKAPRLQDTTETAARLREHQVLARLAREFRVAEEELRLRLTGLRRSTKKPAARDVPVGTPAARPDQWESWLIESLLERPESIQDVAAEVQPGQLTSPGCRRILTKCYELSVAGVTADFSRLLLEFDEPEMKNLLVTLDEERRAKGGHDQRGILDGFRRRLDEQHRSIRTAPLSERKLEEREEDALLQQLIDHERSRRGISAPTDG